MQDVGLDAHRPSHIQPADTRARMSRRHTESFFKIALPV